MNGSHAASLAGQFIELFFGKAEQRCCFGNGNNERLRHTNPQMALEIHVGGPFG